MRANRLWVIANAMLVALVAFPALHALPDPAPPPTAEVSAPPTEARASPASAEKPATASATESPAATPEAAAPTSPPAAETVPIFKVEQLDQLLAPIALYPDALLAQILMAATYPLEVVKAARWLQDPGHANLQAGQLAAALEAESWDPSVKSLVSFPRILRTMDAELDWTEQLGNAVIAQQADVMDTVQRLRHQATAAGTLWSNFEQRVTTERQGIVIEPVNPEFIYPPVYSPAVYGPWPYPDNPPFEISLPDYGIGFLPPSAIGFGVGFAVVQPLWRWCAFDWGQRQIRLDIEKFNALNHREAGIQTSTWRHDMTGHNPVPSSLASRARFQVVHSRLIAPAGLPASMPSKRPPAPTVVSPTGLPASPAVGTLPTAVLRSPTSANARRFQAHINGQPGLGGPQSIAPPMTPPLMLPRDVARSPAWAQGDRAPVSRR